MADLSDLNKLVADFTEAPLRFGMRVEAVMLDGAVKVTNDARSFAPSGPYAPHYPASITYDVEITSEGIGFEVGPDKDKLQGALGNIFEYGTAELAPQSHLGPALDRHAPGIEDRLADAAVRSIFG